MSSTFSIQLLENYSLQNYNTFHIDVKASYFIEYKNIEELTLILSEKKLSEKRLLHIGGGSNLLFTQDFDGVILHSGIQYIDIVEETDDYVILNVGSGVNWDDFVDYCVKKDWRGIENLSLIPGEVGASAVQNIGAYGVEAKDVIVKTDTIEISTGKTKTFLNQECNYSYRNSIFKNELKGKFIITNVYFRLNKKGDFNLDYGTLKEETSKLGEINIENIRKAVISIRDSKLPDPEVVGNAGSFFMNPIIPEIHYQKLLQKYPGIPHYKHSNDNVKVPAGWLIEQCGWKGKQIGNAAVHDKQALVLVNKGGATGKEILHLSQSIQQSVKEKFGIDIYPEVNVF